MLQGNTLDGMSPVRAWLRISRPGWAGLYVVVLSVAALGLLCVVVYVQLAVTTLVPPGPFPWAGLLLLLVVGLYCEKYTVRVGSHIELSASFLTLFLSSAVVGPLGGFIAGVVSPLSIAERGEKMRALFYSSMFGVVSGSTALVYWSALHAFGASEGIVMVAVGLASGLFFLALNYALFLPVSWLRCGMGPAAVWRQGVRPFLPFHFFFLAICLGLVYLYKLYAFNGVERSQFHLGLLTLLCLLPVLGLIYAFRAYSQQLELARSNGFLALHNERLALRNERLALQAVASQVTALDLKDDYTASHSAAVSHWATDIAVRMGLSDREVNLTQLASLLHDVGKIGVPDDVLNCPGRLDAASWAMVASHCRNGHRILSSIDQFAELAEVVLYHHERYDGCGYPTGACGSEIPLVSRIICVADAYSAMISDRPYRRRLDVAVAKEELRRSKGTQFDPVIVDCFLEILEENDDTYQQGKAADFLVEFQKVKYLRDLPPEPEEADEREP